MSDTKSKLIEALEYIEFCTHYRCDRYNFRDCDTNTQEAYEHHLEMMREEIRKVIKDLKA